jgi:hypothetical protein
MITRLFSYPRYLLVIPVPGASIASVAILLYGNLETLRTAGGMLGGEILLKGAKYMVNKPTSFTNRSAFKL